MRAVISLVNGKFFDLCNPNPKLIKIEHIAGSLSKICRFNGQVHKFYSVAQHCCFCTYLARKNGMDKEFQLATLLHDAAEAYCGDVIKPLKNILGQVYKDIETKLEQSIEEKFCVSILNRYNEIKIYDIMAYKKEKILKDPILYTTFTCWGPKKSEREYIKLFKELYD